MASKKKNYSSTTTTVEEVKDTTNTTEEVTTSKVEVSDTADVTATVDTVEKVETSTEDTKETTTEVKSEEVKEETVKETVTENTVQKHYTVRTDKGSYVKKTSDETEAITLADKLADAAVYDSNNKVVHMSVKKVVTASKTEDGPKAKEATVQGVVPVIVPGLKLVLKGVRVYPTQLSNTPNKIANGTYYVESYNEGAARCRISDNRTSFEKKHIMGYIDIKYV